jgi:hypothetical protein
MKFIIALFYISFSSLLFAQTSNDMLLSKYSMDEISNMKINNPNKFKFIEYAATNGYYFVDVPEKKNFNSRITGNVVINNLDEFNFLELDIELLKDDYKYYTVQNKNVLLVVKSIDHIKAEIKSKNDKD